MTLLETLLRNMKHGEEITLGSRDVATGAAGSLTREMIEEAATMVDKVVKDQKCDRRAAVRHAKATNKDMADAFAFGVVPKLMADGFAGDAPISIQGRVGRSREEIRDAKINRRGLVKHTKEQE